MGITNIFQFLAIFTILPQNANIGPIYIGSRSAAVHNFHAFIKKWTIDAIFRWL